jgi:excisionase family DNA binding protein
MAAFNTNLAQSENQAPLPNSSPAQQLPRRRPPKVTESAALGRRLLRTREAAEYLSVSPWKLRRLVQDGLLPIVQDREGAAWRVDLRDLDASLSAIRELNPSLDGFNLAC